MADDADGDNGGALLSDPVDVVIDKLLRYGALVRSLRFFTYYTVVSLGSEAVIWFGFVLFLRRKKYFIVTMQ